MLTMDTTKQIQRTAAVADRTAQGKKKWSREAELWFRLQSLGMKVATFPPMFPQQCSVSCFAKLLLHSWRQVLKRHRQYPVSLTKVELSPVLCKLDLASDHAKLCLFYVDNFQCVYLPSKVCVDCILLRGISARGCDRALLDNTGLGAGAREALVVHPEFRPCSYKLD